MNNSEFIVGIDIGTTKVVAIAGRLNEHGKLEILGLGKSDSLGVKRGVVANIDKTVNSINKAVAAATKDANIQLNQAYVGIAGQHIKSVQHRGLFVRDNIDIEISKDDVLRLKEDMRKLVLSPGDRIIHVLPQEYIIDGEQGIKDPVGMAGIRLEANFHIITGQITAAKNINRSVEKSGIHVEDLILEPLASARAVLTSEDLEAGVAIVDIGGGTTDIAIFQEGIIRHTAVIPLGGDVITEDIKTGFKILKPQAEQLKVQYGCALPQESQLKEVVSIPRNHNREPKQVKVFHLSKVIEARMEEILNMVKFEIKASGYQDKLIGGIVLTGGGAQLKHLVQLTEFVTGLDARVGVPNEHLATSKLKEINNPMYATAIGLLLIGHDEEEEKMYRRGVHVAAQKEEVAVFNEENIGEATEDGTVETITKNEKKSMGSFFNNFTTSLKKWFEDDNDYNDFEE